MQILTVADAERLRRFMPRMRRARVAVATARSSREASKRLHGRGRRPDLVVVDSRLGTEVLHEVVAGAGDTAVLYQDLERLTPQTVAALAEAPSAGPGARSHSAGVHTVPELHDPGSGRLDATRIAEFFGLSLTALAKAIGRSPQTLHKTPDGQRVQAPLAPFARIATSLVTLFGGADKARLWMNAPHPDLDGVAPLELVKGNKADIVADLLEDALLGHPA